MKKTLGLMLVLGLSACANKTDYAFDREIDQQVQQIGVLRDHYRQQTQDSSLDPIRTKVLVSESYLKHSSPCMAGTDEAYPTAAEKAAIRRWATARGEFIAQLAVLAKPPADATERMARFMTQLDQAKLTAAAQISEKLNDLSEGRITYCQFAQASKAINLEAHHQTGGYRNTIDEELILDARLRNGVASGSFSYEARPAGDNP